MSSTLANKVMGPIHNSHSILKLPTNIYINYIENA